MNLLGIESSSRKLSVGLTIGESFSELHSERINDTANSLPQLSNEIINALEQTRIEVKGSKEFKGIKKNLLKKHTQD